MTSMLPVFVMHWELENKAGVDNFISVPTCCTVCISIIPHRNLCNQSNPKWFYLIFWNKNTVPRLSKWIQHSNREPPKTGAGTVNLNHCYITIAYQLWSLQIYCHPDPTLEWSRLYRESNRIWHPGDLLRQAPANMPSHLFICVWWSDPWLHMTYLFVFASCNADFPLALLLPHMNIRRMVAKAELLMSDACQVYRRTATYSIRT